MLVRDGDDLTIISPDLVQIRDALQERGTFGLYGLRSIVGERQHGNRVPGLRQDVDPLMPIL